ncbi:MAG: hypothetical protein C4K58_02770 [Flavobacteriaceae bacterium]|nr:MAG: hypothetical protein C4K58_02770 [Flavobacteriaceae bacterium]
MFGIKKMPFVWVFVFCLVVKCLFLFTHHIQEDAFISWRVAQNLLEYGVLGYNGNVPISASTTHLYVFLSAIFQAIFGFERFVYPLLLFNIFCFTLGSYYFLRVFQAKEEPSFAWIFLLFNLSPPGIKASILGMEYGLVMLLYGLLLYFGLVKKEKKALFIIPFLLLWLRLDMAIFLVFSFFAWIYGHRSFPVYMVLGGILGLATVLGFNYMYFGEVINHTISAKKVAYQDLVLYPGWKRFNFMLKKEFGFLWGCMLCLKPFCM